MSNNEDDNKSGLCDDIHSINVIILTLFDDYNRLREQCISAGCTLEEKYEIPEFEEISSFTTEELTMRLNHSECIKEHLETLTQELRIIRARLCTPARAPEPEPETCHTVI